MTKKLNRKLRNSSWKQGCAASNREIIITEAHLSGGVNRRNVAELRCEEPHCRIEGELSFWLFVIIASCPVKWTQSDSRVITAGIYVNFKSNTIEAFLPDTSHQAALPLSFCNPPFSHTVLLALKLKRQLQQEIPVMCVLPFTDRTLPSLSSLKQRPTSNFHQKQSPQTPRHVS